MTIPEEELRALAQNLSAVLGELHLLGAGPSGHSLDERLHVHLGVDPKGLAVLAQELPPYQLVDVQVAFDAWPVVQPGREVELIGVSGDQRRFHPLSELLASGRSFGVGVGPVDYQDLADSPESTRSCVRFGVFLLQEGDRRAAALLRGADPHGPMQQAMLELVATDDGWGREVLAELKSLSVERSVLRRRVLALGHGEGNQYGALRFMPRPSMPRDELVLPEAVFSQIERHVVGIAEHGDRLRAAGQHLKRGVLLYGPPGTGKTHTVRYLLSELQHVTAFVMSGQALGLIGQACGLARLLQPSLVILEDVDLVAGDRSFGPVGSNPLLFEVLNQIDGLGDDVDVTFLLTTNRVDILERALAERPGRVDVAVEIGLPDAVGRARLFRLYGAGMGVAELSDADLGDAVDATAGRTASYLREVVRRAAVSVAERSTSGALRVDADTLTRAAMDLLADSETLTRALLGGGPEGDPGLSPAGGTGGYEVTSGLGYSAMPMSRMVRTMGGFGSAGPATPFGPEQ